MTAAVLSFPAKHDPHLSGKARCCACRHDWVAVAPVGVDWMECPSCHLMKGRFFYEALPPFGCEKWECGCGCDVFHVTRTAAWCINCGTEQTFT